MPQTHFHKIQSLVELVANVTDAYTAALFLVDEIKNDRLTLIAYQSLSDNIIKNAVVPIGHGLVGWVAKSGKDTVAKNFSNDTKTLQFYSRNENIKSFAAAPIFDGERLLGVLSVDSKEQYVFTEKKAKLLRQFTQTLSSVIVMGRKRLELESDATNIKALEDISEMAGRCLRISELAQGLRRLSPALIPHDQMALALKSPNDDEFQLIQFKSAGNDGVTHETLPLTHYRMGWVIHQARAIYVPNLDASAIPADNKRWHSFIAAPLISGGQVTGAIAFLARKPGGFRQSDLKIVNILASICSSAITGLYIHNSIQSDLSLDPVTATNSCSQLVAKWPRMEELGAVAVVDLKKFGKVNMELGLAGGDAVLVELATRLKKVIGGHGDVSRFGGAKFIVVLKGKGKKQVTALLDETMRLIEEKPFHYQGVDVHITPVMGVSFSPDDGVETERLLYCAYGALQAAKANAGAQLRFHGDDNQQAYGILRSLK